MKRQTIHDDDFSYQVDNLIPKDTTGSHPRLNRFMEIAKNVSLQSSFDQYKLGCVAVFKGKIIAKGFNKVKTHPLQKHYNSFRSDTVEDATHSLHAEMVVLNQLKNMNIDLSEVELIIYRQGRDEKQKMARPCAACMTRSKQDGIGCIHYSTPDGLATEYISKANQLIVKKGKRPI